VEEAAEDAVVTSAAVEWNAIEESDSIETIATAEDHRVPLAAAAISTDAKSRSHALASESSG